jgi:TatA/E family protein of Tat protein translocase
VEIHSHGYVWWWQWVIVLVIVLLLFGRGKIPELMGDVAKGVKNFRKGLSDEGDDARRKMREDGGAQVRRGRRHHATPPRRKADQPLKRHEPGRRSTGRAVSADG